MATAEQLQLTEELGLCRLIGRQQGLEHHHGLGRVSNNVERLANQYVPELTFTCVVYTPQCTALSYRLAPKYCIAKHFTVSRYTSTVFAVVVCLSVPPPSVHLSQAGTVSD